MHTRYAPRETPIRVWAAETIWLRYRTRVGIKLRDAASSISACGFSIRYSEMFWEWAGQMSHQHAAATQGPVG